MRRLRPRLPLAPTPALPPHPFRDAAILQGVLAGLIVVLAWATSGSVGRALVIAVGYFIAATGWVWWRLYERIRRAAGQEEGL